MMDGMRQKKKPNRADYLREILKLRGQNKELTGHNQMLAVYGGQMQTALRIIVRDALAALDGMRLIITPGSRDAKAALEAICKIAAPYAADIPIDELLDMVPEGLRDFFMPLIKTENKDEPEEVTDHAGREFALCGMQEDQG